MIARFLLAAVLLPLSGYLLAVEPGPVKPGSAIATTDPVTVLLGLLFVVGLIFVLAWLLKKVSGGPLLSNSTMKVLSSMSVGTRERVVLVQVGDKQMLLGVGAGSVSQLHIFDEPIIAPNTVQGGEFQKKLQQILGQTNGAGQ